MTDILDDRVDELLRQAEQRLKQDAGSVAIASSSSVIAAAKTPSAPTNTTTKSAPGSSTKGGKAAELAVREPASSQKSAKGKGKEKSTAGSDWFDLPKTELTPEFKRDWALLRMRGILDPKHQKKALHSKPPEYSQVGTIIEGPTDFFSGRMTRKERKGTMLEEVMAAHDNAKFGAKYAGIQKQKASGKKAFYKQVVAQRRKRR